VQVQGVNDLRNRLTDVWLGLQFLETNFWQESQLLQTYRISAFDRIHPILLHSI